MRIKLPVPYVWSIYIVSTGLALSLNFAVLEDLLMDLEWRGVQIAIGLLSL